MIPFEQALDTVLEHTPRLDPRAVPLDQALGLVLADDVKSDLDMPPFDKSAMDGFAVIAADVASPPVRLRIIEDIPAGRTPQKEVRRGTAARIMTGAAVPKGADTVVIVEHTRVQADEVEVLESTPAERNICPRAEDIREGQVVLTEGTRLRPQEIGVLASVGCTRPLVRPAPGARILSTGNEIVPPQASPAAGQIRDSNSLSIQAQALALGVNAECLGIAADVPESLRDKIRTGLDADLFLLSGGVSMGEHDLVRQILAEEGVQILFDRVRIKPGKPTVFGLRANDKLHSALVFGLPGNPTSTLVTFEMFVAPAIRKMMGADNPKPTFTPARYEGKPIRRSDRRQFLPARVTCKADGCRAERVRYHGSADLVGTTRGNALLVVPEGEGHVKSADQIETLLF